MHARAIDLMGSRASAQCSARGSAEELRRPSQSAVKTPRDGRAWLTRPAEGGGRDSAGEKQAGGGTRAAG